MAIEPAADPATPPRPAEEVAREMVSEPVSVDSPNGFCDWSGEIANERVWFLSKDDAFVSLDAIRLGVQHAITRAREEGAAAERTRFAAHPPSELADALDKKAHVQRADGAPMAADITEARARGVRDGAAAERERCAEILRGGRAEIDRYVAMVDEAKRALGAPCEERLVDAAKRVAKERDAATASLTEAQEHLSRIGPSGPQSPVSLARAAIERAITSTAAKPSDLASTSTDDARYFATPEQAAAAWSRATRMLAPAHPTFCLCGKPRPRLDGSLCRCLVCGGIFDLSDPEPRSHDLAGRIRALVMQKAGEWLDAEGAARHRLDDALDDLRFAYQRAKDGQDIEPVIDAMREGVAQNDAADELEAIVRECAPEVRR